MLIQLLSWLTQNIFSFVWTSRMKNIPIDICDERERERVRESERERQTDRERQRERERESTFPYRYRYAWMEYTLLGNLGITRLIKNLQLNSTDSCHMFLRQCSCISISFRYRINTSTPYHTCSTIWTSTIYSPMLYQKLRHEWQTV